MNLINENKLLLYCVQKDMSDNVMDLVKTLLSLPLQWDRILDAAFTENIAPLLYHNLKNMHESNPVSQNNMNRLQNAYYGNVTRNMDLFSELKRILTVFKNQNVNVMVLKGAALANSVYEDIGLRSMMDIDLLVSHEALSEVKEIMAGLGYMMSVEARSETWYRKHHFHLPPFVHKNKSIAVEIHWNIANKTYGIEIKKWWERATTVKIENFDALIPSPEDMIIHLCLHLCYQSYHAKKIKRGIGDIIETLRYYRDVIDWDLLQSEIRLCRMNKIVYSTLYLIREFYETDDNLLVRIDLKHIDLEFIRILKNRILMSSDFPGPFMKYYIAEGLSDKAKALFECVFPEREVMAKNYLAPISSKKLFGYYLIRPFILLVKYGKILFKIIFHIKEYPIKN